MRTLVPTARRGGTSPCSVPCALVLSVTTEDVALVVEGHILRQV